LHHFANSWASGLPDAPPVVDLKAGLWFAVHTRSRLEKVVVQQLEKRNIGYLFPAYQSIRRWKDRNKRLSLPLFPGYLFARVLPSQVVRVLELPGVVRLVGSPRPQPLELQEIDRIQQWCLFPQLLEPHPYLQIGERVRVCRGPFAEVEGILLRKKNSLRLILSVDFIQRSVAVEIDAADLAPN